MRRRLSTVTAGPRLGDGRASGVAGALRTELGQVTMKWEEGGAVDVQPEGGLFRRTLFQGYGDGSGVPSPEPVRRVDLSPPGV